MTRNSKVPENRAELAQDWRERAASIGFAPQQLIAQAEARGPVDQALSPSQEAKAVQLAIGRLSDQEAAFKHSALVAWTLANGMGKLTIQQAEDLIQRERAAGRLHHAELGDQAGWTTVSAHQQELRVHAAVEDGKGAVAPAYAPTEAVAALSDSLLNAGQQKAVEMILTAPDRHVGVVGRPGTGKTFMLGQARELMAARGFELVGMAANAEAARQLQGSAGIPSKTLHKHLSQAGRDVARLRSATPEQRAEIEAKYSKQVWMVDEASQVNNATMRRVLDLAGKLGARTVHVGDTAQLGAIEAGKPFARMVANGMEHREMDEIRRQTDARHVEAIRDVLKQDIGAAMQKLAPETREIPDRDDRLNAMLKDWEAAGQQRDQVLMLSTRNATRTELNDKARQILRAEGKLQGEKSAQQLLPVYASRADTAVVSTYKAGQIVHFPRPLPSMGIERGAYVRVTAVDGAGHHVHLDVGGKTVVWSPQTIAGGSKTPPQIFQPRETSLAAGERITWSKNNAELGLNNGRRLTVIASNDKTMTVQTEDGRRVDIDRSKESNRHWEHGYATTIYKSQGQTAEKVLVDANSQDKNLLSQKAFLVAISRQKDGLTIYTDSIARLTSSVQSNPGDKESAIEARQAVAAPNAREEFERRYQQVSEKAQVQWPMATRKLRTPGLDIER
jgi:ATP-dependent exoDNAse (exonuclease V) alpha subunit